MAIFYRHERFAPLATNHFWLSDTPEIPGSTTWSNVNRRMVTGVRFRDRGSGREFHFWNTHFDHEVEMARQKSAALVRERLKQVSDALPVLLVGDFNTPGGNSRSHDILVKEGGLSDAWTLATTRVNETLNTFHNYRPVENSVRIDWILLRGDARVGRIEILNFAENGQFPSDHFPVMADLVFGVPE
jgi:endonuclease/exonuclease/phosphatase family metal-dependent hydrolase